MAAPPVVAVRRSPVASLLESLETLADPTRLRLLRLLERHELEVAALCDILQLPQSTVSRHLKLLSGQGWLDSRPRGTTRLYRTRAEPDPAARRLWLVSRDQTAGWPTARQDDLRLQRRLSRRSPAEAFFAGAAGRWDRMREEAYGRAFTDAALLGLLPGGWVVADLGCGTGHAAAALSPHVGRVVGVDQSAAMLKAARKRVAGLANVELRPGRLEALPMEDGTCDGALLLLALTYLEEPAAALREMARILRPGGRGVVADLLRHDRDDFRRRMGQRGFGFAPEELKQMMEAAGLEGAACRELPPEPGARGPALLLSTARRPLKPQKERS
ncbi:MAG: ArsR family transcriptional regulator [Acidobacteria bacterium]|nr:MAG: ArsR family transcriptional regulator [Acidobacteriota bacterium]